jgi:hypothetical protein
MRINFAIFSSQFSIFPLPYFEYFFELLRGHKIFHPPINYILSVVAVRRQWIFLLSYSKIPCFINIECFFVSIHYIFIPTAIYFAKGFYWLSIGCSFGNYWNLPSFALLKANLFHCLHRVLFDLSFEIIWQFFVTFPFSSSSKKSFCLRSRIII